MKRDLDARHMSGVDLSASGIEARRREHRAENARRLELRWKRIALVVTVVGLIFAAPPHLTELIAPEQRACAAVLRDMQLVDDARSKGLLTIDSYDRYVRALSREQARCEWR